MNFQVTQIEFDCSLDADDWTFSDQINTEQILNSVYVGTSWKANDEDDLIEKISSKTGWCINFIDYKVTC